MLQKVEYLEKEEKAKRRADFLARYRDIQSQSGVAGETALIASCPVEQVHVAGTC